MRYFSLGVVLFGFWLLLSGHYTNFLLAMGLLSVVAILLFSHRMHIVDAEGHPVHLAPRALLYWPWLLVEICKSAWNVTKIILNPALPISPTATRVKASQKSALGVNIYANSITLTPGTISIEVSGQDIVVHALEKSGADDVEGGAMDARVTQFEGAR